MKKKFNEKIKVKIITKLLWMVFIFFSLFISFMILLKDRVNSLKLSLELTLILGVFESIPILYEHLAEIHVLINKLSKEDFINNEQLYRDILKNYSPILLAYIDKMEFDYDLSVVVGLLDLQNKGYIEICEDRLNVIKFDCYNLNTPEKYIIHNINMNGKVENISKLESIVYEEGKKKGLLISNKKNTVRLTNEQFIKDLKKIMINIVKYYVCVLILGIFLRILNIYYLDNIIVFMITFGLLYYFTYLTKKEENPILYKRSEEAKKLNLKLEGLKNYISQYSLLKEKKSDDILLWKEYLIYSVIFNQNKDIIKEYKKFYM